MAVATPIRHPAVRKGSRPESVRLKPSDRKAIRAKPDAPHRILMRVFKIIFARKLSALIVDRGMEVAEFLSMLQAKTGGCTVTNQSVRNWLRGVSTPRSYLLPLISDVLNVKDYRELQPSPEEIVKEFSERN